MTRETQDLTVELDAIEVAIDQRKGEPAVHQSRLEEIMAALPDDSEQVPRVHRLIGVLLNRRKSDRQALVRLAQAKAKAEQATPPNFGELVKIGRELAVVHAWRGDDRSAALELLPALAFACLLRDQQEVGRIIAEFGRIEIEAQRFPSVARVLTLFAGPVSDEQPQPTLPLPEVELLRMQINLCQALNRVGGHAEAKRRAEQLLAKIPEDNKRLRLLVRLEEARAEGGRGDFAAADRILRELKDFLATWPEGAYEHSEYLQVETELEELKGGPPVVESLEKRIADIERLIEEYSDQTLVIKEAVARRALAKTLYLLGRPADACETLSGALRNALNQKNTTLADDVRADMLKSAGADYLEEVAEAIDLVGGTSEIGRRFVRLGRLGKGGHGEVNKAIDLRNGEYVALKKLDLRAYDDDKRRVIVNTIKTEFAATARLNDVRFVRVIDLLMVPGDAIYIQQEFVEGPTLRKLYSSQAEPERLLGLLANIADSLAHLHAREIEHRDLKPENVIVRRKDGEERPVLIDFGIAFVGGRDDAFAHFGTPPYMAPERMDSDYGKIRGAADVYALGQMIAEIWTGKDEKVPALLGNLVQKMLEGRPKRRFCDLKEIAKALRTPLG